jgi:sulfatase maturation enzyme AslB (radical SAM superfamily)
MNEKTFCVNPWISINYQFGDGYRPCCVYGSNLKFTSIKQYANSTELATLKKQLLAGVPAKECAYCWQEESQGYSSKRLRDNQQFSQVFDYKYKPALESTLDEFVRYYVRLGNHCNLRCVTCRDDVSTGWISENKKFGDPASLPMMLKKTDPIWQSLRDRAAGIGMIEFIGGEPFMMLEREQADLFKYLVKTGHSKHITLLYTTNGTRMPDEQLEYWQHFKRVDIDISIDGIGSRFEYLRFPASWDTVVKNIQQYKKIPKVKLLILHTVSILNAGYLAEMEEFCKTNDLEVFYNKLQDPMILNLHQAPAHTRAWIHSQLDTIDNPVIKQIQTQLHTEHYTAAQDILDYCQKLDTRRGNSLEQDFPELYEQLNADCE